VKISFAARQKTHRSLFEDDEKNGAIEILLSQIQ